MILTKATTITYGSPVYGISGCYKDDVVSYVLNIYKLGETDSELEVLDEYTIRRHWSNKEVAESFLTFCNEIALTYAVPITSTEIVDWESPKSVK